MGMSQAKRGREPGFYHLSAWTLFLVMAAFWSHIAPSATADDRIRRPAVAGYFYPKDPPALRSMVDGFMARVAKTQVSGRIIGLMSPHAGYTFSGQVAAYAYQEIKGRPYDTVVILGPSHRAYLRRASVGNWDAYATPLGRVPVNRELASYLLDRKQFFSFYEEAHIREHSIETQLPFLQRLLLDFDIVPILIGTSSMSELEGISKALASAIKGRNVLFIASSDMSHYPSYRDAMEVDRATLSIIETFDPERLFLSEARTLRKGVENLSTTLCGMSSVVTVMMAAKELGGNTAAVLHYANSGDVEYRGYKEKRRVVGYGAVAFYKR
jgi:AmmeMemoRadiSam system protein B